MPIASRPFEQSESQSYQDVYQPSVSGGQAFAASAELAAQDTATASIYRMYTLNSLEREAQFDQKLDPEKLNEKFPGLEKPFTEAKSVRVAQEIADRQAERRRLENIINAGPKGTLQTVANFGAAMLPHMIDPIELGAGIATGAGLGVIAARSGIATAAIAKTAVGKVGAELASGFAGNLITEPFSTIPAATAEQREYGIKDAAFNAAVGAAGFTAARLVGGKAFKLAKNLGDRALNMKERVSTSQMLEGKRIDVTPVGEMFARQTDIPHEQTGYTFKNLSHEEIKTQTFHAPKQINTPDIKSESAMFSDHYGDGVYMTDNPAVANAAAVRGLDNAQGGIIETKISPDANLVNLDEFVSPTSKFRDAVNSALEGTRNEAGLNKFDRVDLDFLSGKQIFDYLEDQVSQGKLPESIINSVGFEAQVRGIDGYNFKADSVGDVEHSPHNAVVIFNPEKIQTGATRAPNPELIKNPTDTELRALREKQDPIRQHRDFVPDDISRLDSNIENPQVHELRASEIDKQADGHIEEMETADQLGILSESDKKALDGLKQDKAFSEKLSTIAKQAIGCVTRNG